MRNIKNIKVIAFDADDTLWVNEPYYRGTEKEFCNLLKDYDSMKTVSDELYKTEMQNLDIYGYGAKGFMLSLIETALRISGNRVSQDTIKKIIELGKKLLNNPIDLLEDVELVLNTLHEKGRKLILATKGDLLDQERKLRNSGIEKYFHHIEIMSDKKESDYGKLLNHLEIKPEEFLMIGNSLKSDIIPVLNLGGIALHIPYHTTWQHERSGGIEIKNENFREIKKIRDILDLLNYEKSH